MLIYDSFPSRAKAEAFAKRTALEFGRETHICDSQEQSDKIDPFPFALYPPIVLVERDYDAFSHERMIDTKAAKFGGKFAGT